MIEGAPPDALDFIKRCLTFRPSLRLTAAEALEHPFVGEFHGDPKLQSWETRCNRNLSVPVDDNHKQPAELYMKKLHAVIYKKNQQIREERRLKKYLS